jgi:hypothetical protein
MNRPRTPSRFARAVGGVLIVTALVSLGCGAGGPALNQTSITCPAGRTLLDGVCVAEGVADYVACVRAQGAQLGGTKHQQLSAEVGTVGIRAGGAAEVSESLEKKYATSDAAMMEIVRRCSASVAPPPAVVVSPPMPGAAPNVGPAGSGDVSGQWSTTVAWDQGRQRAPATVTFTQKGTHVVGTFYLPNEGRIEGDLTGRELRGTWSRPPYAGHIELTFDAGGKTFRGTYGDAPHVSESWTGQR